MSDYACLHLCVFKYRSIHMWMSMCHSAHTCGGQRSEVRWQFYLLFCPRQCFSLAVICFQSPGCGHLSFQEFSCLHLHSHHRSKGIANVCSCAQVDSGNSGSCLPAGTFLLEPSSQTTQGGNF